MSCKNCGREPENGTPVHWLGCEEAKMRAPSPAYSARQEATAEPVGLCEHGECTNPRRPPGKGPKPKYCTEHSDPKTRK